VCVCGRREGNYLGCSGFLRFEPPAGGRRGSGAFPLPVPTILNNVLKLLIDRQLSRDNTIIALLHRSGQHDEPSFNTRKTRSIVVPREDLPNSLLSSVPSNTQSSDNLSTHAFILELVYSSTTIPICSIR